MLNQVTVIGMVGFLVCFIGNSFLNLNQLRSVSFLRYDTYFSLSHVSFFFTLTETNTV